MKNTFIQNIATAIALLLCCLASGCASDNDLHSPKVDYGRLTMSRLDIKNAVSLGLSQGRSSRAIDGEFLSAGLYKVDANGNITAVGVYFSTDTLGNRLEHEEKLKVVPRQMFDLTKNYLYLTHCDYYDSDGDRVADKWEYDDEDNSTLAKQDVPYKELLVRKSDGKIWCVDNISDMLIYEPYYSYEIVLKGAFNEDADGNLYFKERSNVYKFNLDNNTSSFEQITQYSNFWADEFFFIADHGVVCAVYNYGGMCDFRSELHFAWPHSGFQTIDYNSICETLNPWLERKIPGGKFTSQYGVWSTDAITMRLEKPDLFFSENRHKPIVVIENTATLLSSDSKDYVGGYFNCTFMKPKELERLNKSLDESGWPIGLCYDVNIGTLPGTAELSDSPIQLFGLPDDIYLNNDLGTAVYGTDFESFYVGEDYILTSGEDNWITKIDLKKREWKWLKKLDCYIDFSDGTMFRGKVWGIDISEGHFGSYWFDPVSFEDGFVKFNVTIPPFVGIQDYTLKADGKCYFSGIDPSTGNMVKIIVDITTGEAATEDTAPEYIFETLINLN